MNSNIDKTFITCNFKEKRQTKAQERIKELIEEERANMNNNRYQKGKKSKNHYIQRNDMNKSMDSSIFGGDNENTIEVDNSNMSQS